MTTFSTDWKEHVHLIIVMLYVSVLLQRLYLFEVVSLQEVNANLTLA